MYYKVYAPDGEMFEVPHNKFTKLVLMDNWTQTPPIAAEKPSEEPEKAPKPARIRTRKARKTAASETTSE